MRDYSYWLIFYVALAVNVCVTIAALLRKFLIRKNEGDDDDRLTPRYSILILKYLATYLLATFSDWLQGPYVYAVYDSYGLSQRDILILFVACFTSSLVLGSFVGALADWGGRRRVMLVYAATYTAGCATKHFNSFTILLVGRVLDGIAASILVSIFSAWLVRSHRDANMPEEWLAQSFSLAAYGNSLVAIGAGLLANNVYPRTRLEPISSSGVMYVGGYLAPFDMAIASLMLCGLLCYCLLDENYGNTSGESKLEDLTISDDNQNDDAEESGKDCLLLDKNQGDFNATSEKINQDNKDLLPIRNGDDANLPNATRNNEEGGDNDAVLRSNWHNVLLCGVISSAFEGSFYILYFNWTPILTNTTDQRLPFGVIFGTFMISGMIGSALCSILMDDILRADTIAVGVMAVAACSTAVIATSSETMVYIGMLSCHVCAGVYFPVMNVLKSGIVPEEYRATIYSLYRIPVNAIVLFSLAKNDPTQTASMAQNAAALTFAALLQLYLRDCRVNNTNDDNDDTTAGMSLKPLLLLNQDAATSENQD